MPLQVPRLIPDPPRLDMSAPSTSTQARRRGHQPRCRHAALRWLMAAVLFASSWAAGGLMPARAMTGILGVGTSGPVIPSEENESHSSTPLVMEAGGMRRRVCAAETPNRRPAHRQGESAVPAPRTTSIPRNCSEGHRLANGLMAPMLT